ncbi:argininosuccinate synthase [Sesbania bispinosa]|nr:argininosuccinate synthase [Sesbania bispinosa]
MTTGYVAKEARQGTHYRNRIEPKATADIAKCLWDSSQSNMLQHLIPSSCPHPNLAITIGCINSVIGHLKSHHPASLGPQLSTFSELRELPDPHKIGIRASVD